MRSNAIRCGFARLARPARFPAVVVGVALLIVGSQWLWQRDFGSDLPSPDEWTDIGTETIVPWLQGELSIVTLMTGQPHPTGFTRLLSLGVTGLDGQWNPALVRSFHAVLLAAMAGILLIGLRDALAGPSRWLAPLALVAPLMLPETAGRAPFPVSPDFCLVVITAGLALDGLAIRPVGSGRWWTGAVAGLFSALLLPGGWLAPGVALCVAMARSRRDSVTKREQRTTLLAGTLLVLLGVLPLFLGTSMDRPVSGNDGGADGGTPAGLLAFPFASIGIWTAVLQAPVVVWFALRARARFRDLSQTEWLFLGLVAWIGLLTLIAECCPNATGVDATWLTFALPVALFLLNACAVSHLWQNALSHQRFLAFAGTMAWVGVAVFGFIHRGTNSLEHLALTRTWPAQQAARMRAFVVSGDMSILQSGPPWRRRMVDPEELAACLRSPQLQPVLPPSIRLPLGFATGEENGFSNTPVPNLPPAPVPGPIWFAPAKLSAAWKSDPIMTERITPILQVTFAGDPRLSTDALKLVADDGRESRLEIARYYGTWWQRAHLFVPPGAHSVRLVATAGPDGKWLAFCLPVEIGRAAWWAGFLRKFASHLLAGGALLLTAGIAIDAVTYFHQSTARGFSGSLDPPRWLRTRHPAFTWSLLAVLGAILTANLVAAVARFQSNVLYLDQWEFLDPLFRNGSWWDMFIRQHGPHRQGLAEIVTSLLLNATQWDFRWDSLWIASLLAVSSALALRLKYRLTGKIELLDAWILLLGMSAGQLGSVILTPNASHGVFPLTAILALANLWLHPKPMVRYLGTGVGAFVLTFTGFGIFGGAVAGGLLVITTIRHFWRRENASAVAALGGTAIYLAGGILFLSLNYEFTAAAPGFRFPWTPLTDYIKFSVLMLLLPLGRVGTTLGFYLMGSAGAIALLLALAWGVRRWCRSGAESRDGDVLVLLMGSGLLFVANTTVGRVMFGPIGGFASRYQPLMFTLWMALYLSAKLSRHRLAIISASIIVWTLALVPYADLLTRPSYLIPGTAGMSDGVMHNFEHHAASKAEWIARYLRTGDGEAVQQDGLRAICDVPERAGLEEKLRFLREHHLSFFSSPPDTAGYLPWAVMVEAVWDGAHPASSTPYHMGRQARLTLIARQPGFVTIAAQALEDDMGEPTALLLRFSNEAAKVTLSGPRDRLVVPVQAGLNEVEIQRIAAMDNSAQLLLGPIAWHKRNPVRQDFAGGRTDW